MAGLRTTEFHTGQAYPWLTAWASTVFTVGRSAVTLEPALRLLFAPRRLGLDKRLQKAPPHPTNRTLLAAPGSSGSDTSLSNETLMQGRALKWGGEEAHQQWADFFAG